MGLKKARSSEFKDLDAKAGSLSGNEYVAIQDNITGLDMQVTTTQIANLGSGGGSLPDPVTIADGGTGQTSAAAALAALGGELPLAPTAVKTTTYTASVGDFVPCNTTGGAFTVTLPTAPADGSRIGVKATTFGAGNNVTVATGGSDVFNVAGGSATFTLSSVQMGITVQYKASTAIWYVLSKDEALANPVTVARGGTGAATLTNHGVLVGQATSAVAATAAGTSGQPLLSGGASADPAYGTLSAAFGGTGATTLTAHGVLVGEGTSAVAATSAGTAGTPLVSGGASADPSFGAMVDTAATVVNASDATKVAKFDLSGATTGKTATLALPVTNNRTITFFDASDTVVGKATTDTLTNKTLTAAALGSSTATTQAALDGSTKVATTLYVDNGLSTVPLNDQTGTSYTLVITDAGKLVTLSNASAIALTIPANASVAFAVGTQIQILQKGAGQVTVGITTDTLNGTPGLKTRAQYSMATLTKTTSTTWVASGDLSA